MAYIAFLEYTDDIWRHHKGSTPAEGSSRDYPSGHPVLLPGSMGSSSYVLVGNGDKQAGRSVAHGAGRKLSRGDAGRTEFDPEALQIVTPIDRQDIVNQGRRDMLIEDDRRIREESPLAYKDIDSVVDAIETAGAARKVVRLKPLLTVKV